VDSTVEVRLPYEGSLIAEILEQNFVSHFASIPRAPAGVYAPEIPSTFQNQWHHDLAMLECKMPDNCPAAPSKWHWESVVHPQ